jgi:hypothetical protein
MALDLNATSDTSYRCLAIVKAVSCRLPTAAARVRAQVRSCGICGGQSGAGGGYIRVFRFPLPILIKSTASYSLIALSSTLYNADAGSVIK